jgi:hypothetical protein
MPGKRNRFAVGHRPGSRQAAHQRGDYQRGIECCRAGDRCPPDASAAFREGYRMEQRRHVGPFWTVPARYEAPVLRRVK